MKEAEKEQAALSINPANLKVGELAMVGNSVFKITKLSHEAWNGIDAWVIEYEAHEKL